jgi:DNA processing protein
MSPASIKEQLPFALSLARMGGINPGDAKKLIDSFGSARGVFDAAREEIARVLDPGRHAAAKAEKILSFDGLKKTGQEIAQALDLGIAFLIYGMEGYPESLGNIPDPPVVLFVRGRVDKRDFLSLSVVGTRNPTTYGRSTTRMLSGELAACGLTIVSGLARGVDSEAHAAALNGGGRTIAVVGTGLDMTYPRENTRLAGKIAANGAVISEYPPGAGPDPWHFPERNRIIAGLGLGTLVVEAPVKSGALITARLAAEYNREVMAVPGNITSSRSAGCNRLIKDGAVSVSGTEDALNALGLEREIIRKTASPPALSPQEALILQAMGEEGDLAENIIQKSGLLPQAVSAILLQLELRGVVRRNPGNIYTSV